jgi:VIT1/CCC1 family predicted Fe2+/Mn2+ transporter
LEKANRTAAILTDFIRCVRGVYRQRAIYRLDVGHRLGEIKANYNPLCALLSSCPPDPVGQETARGSGSGSAVSFVLGVLIPLARSLALSSSHFLSLTVILTTVFMSYLLSFVLSYLVTQSFSDPHVLSAAATFSPSE